MGLDSCSCVGLIGEGDWQLFDGLDRLADGAGGRFPGGGNFAGGASDDSSKMEATSLPKSERVDAVCFVGEEDCFCAAAAAALLALRFAACKSQAILPASLRPEIYAPAAVAGCSRQVASPANKSRFSHRGSAKIS